MTFYDSGHHAQFAIQCRLCGTNKKITSKCLDCNMLMCDLCKERKHTKFEKSTNHRIVGIKDVGTDDKIRGSDLDFSGLQCKDHYGNVHCLFCKTCNCLVCPSCLVKAHKSHEFSEIREEYENKRRVLLERKFQLNKSKDEVIEIDNQLQKTAENEFLKYMKIKQEISDRQSVLRKTIEEYTNEFKKEVENNWESIKNSVNKEKASTEMIRQNIITTSNQIDILLESTDGAMIFDGVKQIGDSQENNVSAISLTLGGMPLFVAGNLTKDEFGSLSSESYC